ncbi:NAD(P)/FAD-dependent oxidoreductase [candidate division KSB1 bacterium]|nr:NAD(P)/FAD-dependent oxidoreductase [candidate division KSB1 bacterium]
MERIEICIVGSGPAGIATAAALVQRRPSLRDHVLVLEKVQHPRHKLCGGGLTPWVDEILRELGLEAQVPDFRIERVRFYVNDAPLLFDIPGLMRTVRRNEFDAALANSLRSKGVRLMENVAVQSLSEQSDGMLLHTTAGDFFAKLVVGADGAKSVVRRQFFREEISRVSRLLEVLVPARNGALEDFNSQTALIDFRPMRAGLQGYVWDFPCWIDGRPHLNVGLFDSRVHENAAQTRADLPALLEQHLAARGFEPSTKVMGHPERWHHSADCFSRPRVLLAGEAAGIEPWLGEGISAALAYGPIAAETLLHALDTKDFSLRDYRERLRAHRLGKFLQRNRIVARLFYSRHLRAALPLFGRVLQGYMRLKHKSH